MLMGIMEAKRFHIKKLAIAGDSLVGYLKLWKSSKKISDWTIEPTAHDAWILMESFES